MSVTLPVSFQYPEMIVDVTLRPWCTSHWMPSVISSSPRQIALRLLRLLLQAEELARVVELSHSELPGIRHLGQHDVGIRPGCPEVLDHRGDTADDEVVAQVHDEVVVAEELPGLQDRVRQAQRG
jgi:hypothetical protein